MKDFSSLARSRVEIAARVAQDVREGWYVNLGIGIPTLIADHVPTEREVLFHSENGILGMGRAPEPEERDSWLINAGKQYVTVIPGASYFHHADSFGMARGAHLDLCVLGAYQVAENGDLANWSLGDTSAGQVPAVGGAMDLAVGAKRVWVLMTLRTKTGHNKLRRTCEYPLTAPGCVNRIYTELAVIDVTDEGFVARELVDGVSIDDLQSFVDSPITMVSSPLTG